MKKSLFLFVFPLTLISYGCVTTGAKERRRPLSEAPPCVQVLGYLASNEIICDCAIKDVDLNGIKDFEITYIAGFKSKVGVRKKLGKLRAKKAQQLIPLKNLIKKDDKEHVDIFKLIGGITFAMGDVFKKMTWPTDKVILRGTLELLSTAPYDGEFIASISDCEKCSVPFNPAVTETAKEFVRCIYETWYFKETPY